MLTPESSSSHSIAPPAATAPAAFLTRLGLHVVRYGLALVILWIGAMKFTAYEANGIEPLVRNSPLLSWAYDILSVRAFSNVLGVVELIIGLLIALRPWSSTLAAAGSAAAVAMFLTTLTFLFSTPGWEASLGGFPSLAVVPGQFLLKDLVLLGGALWSLGDAIEHSAPRGARYD